MNRFNTHLLLSAILIPLTYFGSVGQPLDRDNGSPWAEIAAAYPPPSFQGRDITHRSAERLDSAYRYNYSIASNSWDIFQRDINQYPSPNEEIIISEEWNPSTLSWEPRFKRVQNYDPVALTEDNIWQEWDASLSNWQSVSRAIYERDVQGRTIRESYLDWSGTQWLGNIQYLNTYAASGEDYVLTVQFWDMGLNIWENAYKDSIISIPPIGFLPVATWEWNGIDQWNSISRTNLMFNNDNLLAQSISENYASSSMTWKQSNQNIYSYDMQNQVIERIAKNWDEGQGIWKDRARILYGYDANGNRTSFIAQEWDVSLLDWQHDRQVLSTFDTANRLQEQSSYTWQSSIWEKDTRQVYQYTLSGEVEQQITYVKDFGPNTWMASSKIDYYWSTVAASNSNQMAPVLCEISNPMQFGQLYSCSALRPSKSYTLSFYDLSGRLLAQQSIRGSDSFALAQSHPAGMYFLLIRDQQRIYYSQKIMIE